MSEHFGEMYQSEDHMTAVMERWVDVPVEEVWQHLAEESKRVAWLAPGTIDLFTGGRARLDFKDSYVVVDSTVSACEAPALLEFSWSGPDDPARPIRFELSEENGGCRIKLTVSIPNDEVVARSCAGWEAHLTMLLAALHGAPTKFPLERFNECRSYFEQELARIMLTSVDVLKL